MRGAGQSRAGADLKLSGRQVQICSTVERMTETKDIDAPQVAIARLEAENARLRDGMTRLSYLLETDAQIGALHDTLADPPGSVGS